MTYLECSTEAQAQRAVRRFYERGMQAYYLKLRDDWYEVRAWRI